MPNAQIKNTNTKIHKYSIWRSARKTQHVVYFWKENSSRISKITFPCAKRTNTKNTNIKYTNTQIQHLTKCQKDPTRGIFLTIWLFKDYKNYIPIQYKLEHLNFAQGLVWDGFLKVLIIHLVNSLTSQTLRPALAVESPSILRSRWFLLLIIFNVFVDDDSYF